MKRASTLLSVAIFAALTTGSALAQPEPQTIAALETALADSFRTGHVPGAAVAVIENGEVVSLRGYGLADVAAQRPATPDTVFRAGSISKSFTGVLFMQLVEQHTLSLDATLSEAAPDITFENEWQDERPVILAQLMEHTSGWADIPARYYLTDATGWSLQRAIAFGDGTRQTRWQPGFYYSYSNAGPSAVGHAMERATGMEFAELMRTRLLTPLAMQHSSFASQGAAADEVALSYARDGAPTPVHDIGLAPSSSLRTTARDMTRFVQFMINRGELDGTRLLTSDSIERIERQETSLASRAGLTNGYGLGNAPIFARRAIFRGHSGEIDSFVSIYAYNASLSAGFVILANGGSISPAASNILEYLSRSVEAPSMRPPQLSESLVRAHAGIYQPMTAQHELQRIYADLLAYRFVDRSDGALMFAGRPLLPINDRLWRRADRAEPSVAFVETQGGHRLMLDDTGAWIQRPAVLVWAKIALIALTAICLVAGLLLVPVWVVSAFLGRLQTRGGPLVRLAPVAGLVLLAATLALPVLAPEVLGQSQLELFGRPSAAAWAVFASSILFPMVAICSLWLAYRQRAASRFVRGYAGLCAVLLLVAAAHLASFGWIGIRMWLT